MPQVLDVEPLRAFARRAGKRIAIAQVAKRFERWAFERLLADPRNFRPAAADELSVAPAWAAAVAARGETVCVFALNRSASARLHTFARWLADACALATKSVAAHPQDAAVIGAARAFLAKIDHAGYEAAQLKAREFSQRLASMELGEVSRLCPPQEHPATQGRVWRKVTSLAELRRAGREFHNCLVRVSATSSYGGRFQEGLVQFWVLRDAADAGRMIAMAPAPAPKCFLEVRTPRNGGVCAQDPDLLRLAAALDFPPPEAPPPPPPPVAAALRAWLAQQPPARQRPPPALARRRGQPLSAPTRRADAL